MLRGVSFTVVLIWPQQLSASQLLMDFILLPLCIVELLHRRIRQIEWNGQSQRESVAKPGTNPVFPRFLPHPLDLPHSWANLTVWRHGEKPPSLLPTFASHAMALFLLPKEQVVWKGSQCLLHISLFPMTAFVCFCHIWLNIILPRNLVRC